MTSSIEERVNRAMYAVERMPRVSAGRIRYGSAPPPKPDGGRSSHETETTRIRISPTQYTGNEIPRNANVIPNPSTHVDCLTADTMPMRTPETVANSIETDARYRVFGKCSRIPSRTGCRVMYERPQSP